MQRQTKDEAIDGGGLAGTLSGADLRYERPGERWLAGGRLC